MVAEYALAQSDSGRYRDQGYLFPLQVFDEAEVARLREQLDQARADIAAAGMAADTMALLRNNVHYLFPFVAESARDPRLLDAVASILGPNLLLYSAEFFIKPAMTEKIVSWHQDLTYWGLGETDDELTAWVAFSEVNVESGCMRFLPGSHRQPILPHRDSFDENNLLSRGQEVAVEVDENDAVDVILEAGQASFHHGRIFHASGPNQSAHDRIGLALRFITPDVRQQVASRDYAMLLRGEDSTQNWNHVAPPLRNLDPSSVELHGRIKALQMQALAAGADQRLHAAYF